jgi:hypothetical protein
MGPSAFASSPSALAFNFNQYSPSFAFHDMTNYPAAADFFVQ